MRVTDSMRYASTIQAEQSAAQRLQRLSEQASSGNTVNSPSDDPSTYAAVSSLDGRLAVLQSRNTNNTNAAGDLDQAETVLSSVNDALVRVKEIAVAMADGTVDPGTRKNAAIEVNSIRQNLISLGNSRGVNGYLFGGSKTDTAPFAVDGTFQGNDVTTQLPVADGSLASTNSSGARAFTSAGGNDILGDLATFATALTNNDVTSIRATTSQMDDDQRQVVGVQTETGLNADRLRTSATVTQTAIDNVQTQKANLTQGDAVALYSSFTAAQASYQRALAVSQQVLSTLSQTR